MERRLTLHERFRKRVDECKAQGLDWENDQECCCLLQIHHDVLLDEYGDPIPEYADLTKEVKTDLQLYYFLHHFSLEGYGEPDPRMAPVEAYSDHDLSDISDLDD